MNASTSGRPCARHRVWCALQNGFCWCSIHSEQNGSRHGSRPVGSAAGTAAAQPGRVGCPLADPGAAVAPAQPQAAASVPAAERRCTRSGLVARSTAGPDQRRRPRSRVVRDAAHRFWCAEHNPFPLGERSQPGHRAEAAAQHRMVGVGTYTSTRNSARTTAISFSTSPATTSSRGRRGRSQAHLAPGEPARRLQRRPRVLHAQVAVGVDRGRDRGMPEQLLHPLHPRASAQQPGRVGVAEPVRAERDPGPPAQPLDQVIDRRVASADARADGPTG